MLKVCSSFSHPPSLHHPDQRVKKGKRKRRRNNFEGRKRRKKDQKFHSTLGRLLGGKKNVWDFSSHKEKRPQGNWRWKSKFWLSFHFILFLVISISTNSPCSLLWCRCKQAQASIAFPRRVRTVFALFPHAKGHHMTVPCGIHQNVVEKSCQRKFKDTVGAEEPPWQERKLPRTHFFRRPRR